MRILKLGALLLALTIGWLVSWSNHDTTSFKFLVWQLPEMPVFGLYFSFLFIGLILGLLLGRFSRRS